MKNILHEINFWISIIGNIIDIIITAWFILFFIVGGELKATIYWQNIPRFLKSIKNYFKN